MNYEEIGKRFIEICEKLDNMGVFYGNNYSGKYHEEYPHSSYWFSIDLDKHRGGFTSKIMHDGDIEKYISEVTGDNPSIMIIELLEKTYQYFTEEGLENDADQ